MIEALLFTLSFCLVLYGFCAFFGPRQLYKIQAQRASDDPEDIFRYFDAHGVSRHVVETAVRTLRSCTGLESLNPRPSDRLCEEYGICGEDIDLLALELAGWEPYAYQGASGAFPEDHPIETVADLVLFLSRE